MTIDIDAIRQREQAATPGPWMADRVDIKPDVFNPSRPNHRVVTPAGALTAFCGEGTQGEENAEFIAHARTDIPALLAQVEQLAEYASDNHRLAVEVVKLLAEVDRLRTVLAEAQGMAHAFDTPRDSGRVRVFVGDLRHVLHKGLGGDR